MNAGGQSSGIMDLMFILSAVIFTLLAIVVATSLLNNRSSSANALLGSSSGLEVSRQNGHVAEARKTICATSPRRKKKAVDDWCEISGSAHDHWDVVKTVLSVSPPGCFSLCNPEFNPCNDSFPALRCGAGSRGVRSTVTQL